MFNMQNMAKMLDPILKPLIEKYEPDFKAFIECIKGMDKRLKNQEAFNSDLNRNVLSLHQKVNDLHSLLEDMSHARNGTGNTGGADGSSNSDNAGSSSGGTPTRDATGAGAGIQ